MEIKVRDMIEFYQSGKKNVFYIHAKFSGIELNVLRVTTFYVFNRLYNVCHIYALANQGTFPSAF